MGGGSSEDAEPNLTPLLDLVLQLVMFFMISANFLMEQVNEAVVLPSAQMASPPEKKDNSLIFINIDKDGNVLLQGANPIKIVQLATTLKQEYNDAQRKKSQPLIILRAHKEATFKQVFEVMNLCKTVGFSKVQLRAIIKGGGGKK